MDNNKKTILIADDDFDFLKQMEIYIKQFGYNTILADSQKQCEEIILTQKPDLAIVDLMMENEDSGFILSYKIKKKYPDVPVIIVSAVSAETGIIFEPENEFEKKWIKADTFMEKGIRPDQLQREISKLLGDN